MTISVQPSSFITGLFSCIFRFYVILRIDQGLISVLYKVAVPIGDIKKELYKPYRHIK